MAARHAVCGLLMLLTIVGSHAAASGADETQVKAAFLYKFLGYVEWPPQVFRAPDSALTIGIVEDEALADSLTQIAATRTVGSRPVSIRKLRRGDSFAGLHALFIGAAAEDGMAAMLAATKGQPVLTVTESVQGLARGSHINFIVVDNRLRFDVALPSTAPDSMKISARLLAVARKVVAGNS